MWSNLSKGNREYLLVKTEIYKKGFFVQRDPMLSAFGIVIKSEYHISHSMVVPVLIICLLDPPTLYHSSYVGLCFHILNQVEFGKFQ